MRRPDLYATDWDALWYLARRKGIEHPERCKIMCSGCGAELAAPGSFTFAIGLVHIQPDCFGDFGKILFLEQKRLGEWMPAGRALEAQTAHDPTRPPLMF